MSRKTSDKICRSPLEKMFSKEEAARLRRQFWISFGQYMKPIPGAEGMPVNWVNYKTGVKNIFFRMDAEKRYSSIAIEIAHPDEGIRELFFEQFQEFRSMFENILGEQWDWLPSVTNSYGKQVARIELVLQNVSVYNQQQWADIIAFLKQCIISLDEFWTVVKPVFEDLK